MGTTLVRGRYVIAGVDRGRPSVVEDGAVLQRDGVVVEVGPAAELTRRGPVDQTLGSPDHVVLPGFVNSHHHVGLTPFQLGSPDLPLELWFASRLAARDVDPYLDTLYSAFDMLSAGVTTVQHLHGWRGAPASRVAGVAERILKAYDDVGMRVSYSYALRDQNRLVYEADEDFCRRLPPALGEELREYLAAQSIPLPDHLGLFADLWERVGRNTGERARVQLAPANLHWCSDEALRSLREYADKYDVGLHMHLVETAYQKEYARRRTGATALRHLEALGLLGPRMTLGHGVWLTEDDVDLAARTGTMVCHNASSNLRLRSGVAPLNRFQARGLRVGLGLDEAGINDDRDMFQEMRLVLRLHRVPGMGADGRPGLRDGDRGGRRHHRLRRAHREARAGHRGRPGPAALGEPRRALSRSGHRAGGRDRAPGPRGRGGHRDGGGGGGAARRALHARGSGGGARGARRRPPRPAHAGGGAPAPARPRGLPARAAVL
jgi:cytosine/adenosine deaminase-related metal-dependent hydrolase